MLKRLNETSSHKQGWYYNILFKQCIEAVSYQDVRVEE